MLQNSMKRFDLDHVTEEDDVYGRCDTSYTVKGAENTSLVIEKKKDLNSCKKRFKLDSILQSNSYKFRAVSTLQAFPLFLVTADF